MLDDLTVRPVLGLLIPKVLFSLKYSGPLSWLYITDDGRELFGVPLGVPFGVDDVLSALAFLELDRGVILELRKALTGVSIACLLSLSFVRLPVFRGVLLCIGGDVQDAGESTFFGKNEGLPDHCGECDDAKERPLAVEFCFWFIVSIPPQGRQGYGMVFSRQETL